MNPWNRFLSGIRTLFSKRALEADMADEMRQHLDRCTEANVAAGMSLEDARCEAHRQFGHVDSLKEDARDARGGRALEHILQDVRYGVRTMIKRPGFALAVVLTLALGIGFVTTLFTMINGVIFTQLPFPEPQQIVNIGVSASQYDDYARDQQSCETFAFFQQISANLRTENFASRDFAVVVSANFFDVLRAAPRLGRTFLPSDAEAGASPAVVIGHAVWEREFQKNPAAIGRTIQINGETRAVIGVMLPAPCDAHQRQLSRVDPGAAAGGGSLGGME